MGNGAVGRARLVSLASLVVAAALVVVAPTGASAATQLGETFPNPQGCAGDTTYIQTDSPGPPYEVPAAGVITSWSHQAAGNPPAQMQFKLGQPAGGDDFTIVAESALETIAPNSLNTFQTQIPVDAGDLIGFYLSEGGGQCSVPDPTFTDFYFGGDVPPGDTETFSEESFQLDIAATLETKKCKGRAPTVGGTAGKDTLRGTPDNDVIVGLDGKDKIKGLDGKDRICGGKGKDNLKGGGDNDTLKGAKGDDKFNGGSGEDTCSGAKGDDVAKKCEIEKSI